MENSAKALMEDIFAKHPERAELLTRYFFIHIEQCGMCKDGYNNIIAHLFETICPDDKKFILGESENQDGK